MVPDADEDEVAGAPPAKKLRGPAVGPLHTYPLAPLGQMSVFALGENKQVCVPASTLYDLCGLEKQKRSCMTRDIKKRVPVDERILATGLAGHHAPTGAYCLTAPGILHLLQFLAASKRTVDLKRLARCARAVANTLVRDHYPALLDTWLETMPTHPQHERKEPASDDEMEAQPVAVAEPAEEGDDEEVDAEPPALELAQAAADL